MNKLLIISNPIDEWSQFNQTLYNSINEGNIIYMGENNK